MRVKHNTVSSSLFRLVLDIPCLIVVTTRIWSIWIEVLHGIIELTNGQKDIDGRLNVQIVEIGVRELCRPPRAETQFKSIK